MGVLFMTPVSFDKICLIYYGVWQLTSKIFSKSSVLQRFLSLTTINNYPSSILEVSILQGISIQKILLETDSACLTDVSVQRELTVLRHTFATIVYPQRCCKHNMMDASFLLEKIFIWSKRQ